MKKVQFNENWIYDGKNITLPHDAMLQSGRDPKSPTGTAGGFFKPGTYEYTKTFKAEKQWKDKHVVLQFEGIYKNSKVYLNDQEIGGAAYGYIPFFIELDPYLQYDKENTLKVIADNSDAPNSRWYSGGGIYRPVSLYIGEKEYIEPQGIKVDTLSINPARIRIQAQAKGTVSKIEILNQGKVIAEATTAPAEFEIKDAKLWDENNPYLYTCKVTLTSGDEDEVRFGIRTVKVTEKGLLINGQPTYLRGGCLHHDNGVLGACAYDGAEYRRVKKMKDAGYNAIRSAHNPCSRAMLEACDELGVYMMDETWDMWFHHKNPYDYALYWRENYKSDLLAMVDKDYNHPSVIFYSIGNEVSEPAKEEGVAKAREMVEILHKADPSRPVTGGFNLMIIANAQKGKGIYDDEKGGMKEDNSSKMSGMNSTMFNLIATMVGTGMNSAANSSSADKACSPLLDSLDISGYNYASGRYEKDLKLHPNRMIFGSETFPQDIAKNWAMVKKLPNLVGDFMWTSWDYLGEAGLGAWGYTNDAKSFNKPYPWFIAGAGAFDIIGDANSPIALARAAWQLEEKPWIGVRPVNHDNKTPIKSTWRGSNAINSYNWKGCDGNRMIVEVYGKGTDVELLQNGKSLGKKKLVNCQAMYKGKYVPGKLEAVVYEKGIEIGRSELCSEDGETHICAKDEQVKDLHFVEIAIVNQNGTVQSNADDKLTVTVTNGKLLGFGSANPCTEEDFLSGSYTTFYGKALAVVQGENAKVSIASERNGTVEIVL